MMPTVEKLEEKLDSFNPAERKASLEKLAKLVKSCEIAIPDDTGEINLHCHTFFSYNAYGYSPSKYAWLTRRRGLNVAGIIDFDVLDGLEEFFSAGKLLNLKTSVGLETRVFVPELADKEISSPGEPGITYHIGIGFARAKFEGTTGEFLSRLRKLAQDRNRQLMERVNQYLSPVELDYEKEVLSLTPSGNATERHLSLAYARKAKVIFRDNKQLARLWADKLSADEKTIQVWLPEGLELLNLIRAKTMKRGGAGYVIPDKGSFPQIKQTNDFFLQAGAIPTLAWLDGTSEGEKDIEKLLEIATANGTEAINIVPDRNYQPDVKDEKLANLYKAVKAAQKLDMPIAVGTEMNSSGQKFIDNFKSKELRPLVPEFLRGAYIIYAHSALQRQCSLGYIGKWADNNFKNKKAKNDFFAELGQILRPQHENALENFNENSNTKEILETIMNYDL